MVLLLDPYVGAILLLALAFLIVGIMRSLAPLLVKVPFVGSSLAGWVDGMAQAIAHACGVALRGVDNAIGGSFHAIARFLGHTWGQFRSHAEALLSAAAAIQALVAAFHGIRSLVHQLEHAGARVGGSIKTLEREWHGIEHRVKTLERDLAKGIGHDLRIQIRALERWRTSAETAIDTTIPRAIAGVSGDLASLRQWLGVKAGANFKDWAAGLLLAGLAALGLSGLNCDSNPFKNNPNACSLWGTLAKLLGLAAFLTVAFDFQEFVDASDQAAAFIGNAVADFEGTFPIALPPLPPPQT